MARMGLQAALTGLFCIAFALVVDAVTDALPLLWVVVLSFASGALGSLFAQIVLRGRGAGHPARDALRGEGAK